MGNGKEGAGIINIRILVSQGFFLQVSIMIFFILTGLGYPCVQEYLQPHNQFLSTFFALGTELVI